MSSTETITTLIDAERNRHPQLAANLVNEGLTSFVLAAAVEQAERIIADRSTTLPAAFFDEFFVSLAPSPAPALVRAPGFS